jgi:hypothetical protein
MRMLIRDDGIRIGINSYLFTTNCSIVQVKHIEPVFINFEKKSICYLGKYGLEKFETHEARYKFARRYGFRSYLEMKTRFNIDNNLKYVELISVEYQ